MVMCVAVTGMAGCVPLRLGLEAPADTVQIYSDSRADGDGSAIEGAASAGRDASGDGSSLPSSGSRSDLSRRFGKLFSPEGQERSAGNLSKAERDVGGAWILDEQDGLRVCRVTLLLSVSGRVLRAPDCKGMVAKIAGWSLSGPELQLRDERGGLLARLRRDDTVEGWKGLTAGDGTLVAMTRD